jgi:hypothetical protein
MLMRSVLILTLALFAQACAHKGAVKVDCNGPLRPINQPTSSQQPPVSVEPLKNDSPDPSEKRP